MLYQVWRPNQLQRAGGHNDYKVSSTTIPFCTIGVKYFWTTISILEGANAKLKTGFFHHRD